MERRLTAILAIDAAGYSGLMAKDEAGTHERFQTILEQIVKPSVRQCQGHMIKFMGDGGLIEFASALDALNCAVHIQKESKRSQRDLPDEDRIWFRMGLHIGDVIVAGDDIYGEGVNVAARLEKLADPGSIFLSRTMFENTHAKVGHSFDALGSRNLKNIPEPIEVYKLSIGRMPVSRRSRAPRAIKPLIPVLAGGLVVFVVLFQLWPKQHDIAENEGIDPSSKPALAVMPFENLSGSTDDDYFADGLTDDLITDLAQISGLDVIARNTVFAYRGDEVSLQDVAHQLGVRYMLEGSVRRAGERVRINAQLLDVRSGAHLWADRIDRDTHDVFAAQDQVIAQIVDALAIQLSPVEQQQLERLPTEDLEAYDYYLRGERAARTGFRPDLQRALAIFARAIALDPDFAKAYAADARTAAYVLRSNYDDIMPFPIARKRAYEHASRAMSIDPVAALPFAVLAVLQSFDGRHDEALKSARRAVELGPSDADAHAALSLVLTFGGRHAEAVEAIENARRLNPALPVGDSIVAGLAYILNGQPEQAIEVLESARSRTAAVDDLLAVLAAAYAQAGRIREARAAAEAAVRAGPNISVEMYRANLGNFQQDDDLERILALMARGGLQKWPFAFRPRARPRLGGDTLREIAFGKTWTGRLDGVGPGIMQITADGDWAIRTVDLFTIGRAFVRENSLCVIRDSLSPGRIVCGPVYAGPMQGGGAEFDYTYVNADMVFHFTPDD